MYTCRRFDSVQPYPQQSVVLFLRSPSRLYTAASQRAAFYASIDPVKAAVLRALVLPPLTLSVV